MSKNRNAIIIFVIFIIMLSGCQGHSNTNVVVISGEQAKTIVQEYQEKNSNLGKTQITSITHKNNKYEVTWERKSNCENGTDFVDDKDGTITRSEVTIC